MVCRAMPDRDISAQLFCSAHHSSCPKVGPETVRRLKLWPLTRRHFGPFARRLFIFGKGTSKFCRFLLQGVEGVWGFSKVHCWFLLPQASCSWMTCRLRVYCCLLERLSTKQPPVILLGYPQLETEATRSRAVFVQCLPVFPLVSQSHSRTWAELSNPTSCPSTQGAEAKSSITAICTF